MQYIFAARTDTSAKVCLRHNAIHI